MKLGSASKCFVVGFAAIFANNWGSLNIYDTLAEVCKSRIEMQGLWIAVPCLGRGQEFHPQRLPGQLHRQQLLNRSLPAHSQAQLSRPPHTHP